MFSIPEFAVQQVEAVLVFSCSGHVHSDRQSLWQFFLTGIFYDQNIITCRRQTSSQLHVDLKKKTVIQTYSDISKSNTHTAEAFSLSPLLHHSRCRRPCRGGVGWPSQLGRGVADGCRCGSWHRYRWWRGRSPETDICTADSWTDTKRETDRHQNTRTERLNVLTR